MGAEVVVTGIGLATGLGLGREQTWQAMREGRSALRRLEEVGTPSAPYYGAPVTKVRPLLRPSVDRGEQTEEPVLRWLDAIVAEALRDAGFGAATTLYHPERSAVLIGSSKGGIRSLGLLQGLVRETAPDSTAVAKAFMASWPSAGASRVAQALDFRGPCLAPVAACATGLVAVLQAVDLIRRGTCDLALAGSVDAALEPLLLATFRRMRILAAVPGEPSEAIRPWDRNRSGFLVGEGGALFVLERADRARARGISPYAEVVGGALGADGFHETDLDPNPEGLANVLQHALRRARVAPRDVDHVNVHGTATRPNDPLECRAIHRALGDGARQVVCTANKSQIGHLLGAAGSAELAIACLSIRDGFIPPTLNLRDPAPECDLDVVANVGRSLPIRVALKISIGFGGHLAAAVVRRPEGPCRAPRGL
jgi:3-oxoacyl-(acyl-carrier-protein) synthase